MGLKILMVNKFLYPRGGAETYFLKIGKYYEEQGHEVQYFGMYDEKNTVGNQLGAYTYNMDFHGSGLKRFVYPFKILYSLEAKKKITKIIKTFHPDIIHFNNINFQLTPAIIEAGAKEGVAMIQTVHDYQMLCPNHLMFDVHTQTPCELCLDGSKWNCAKKSCIHGSKIKSILGSIEARIYAKRKTYEKVHLYVCPSYFMQKKLLTQPLYQNKTVAIHNFIEKIKEYKEVQKEDYVLYFGRLSEEKGFEMFLNACRKLPQIQFVVAGTGPMQEMCNGIENVKYVGFKTGEDLDNLIRKALFSVYPSIWYENCPLSVLESESLGTPVLATKMGGIPELIEDGQTGVLLSEISEKELKEKMQQLYENKELLAEMSKNCLAKRSEMIELEKYCSRLMECYERAIWAAKQ